MPSRDVNAVTRLAEASWWRDNGCNKFFRKVLDMGSLKKVGRPSMTCLEHNRWYFFGLHDNDRRK